MTNTIATAKEMKREYQRIAASVFVCTYSVEYRMTNEQESAVVRSVEGARI